MQGMMRDPKEAFHLSLMRKDDTAPPFTSEAEFTPETVEPPKQVSSAHGYLTAWGQAINTLLVPMSTVNGVLRLVQPTVVAAVRIP
jgi:hypothetical protein